MDLHAYYLTKAQRYASSLDLLHHTARRSGRHDDPIKRAVSALQCPERPYRLRTASVTALQGPERPHRLR